MSKERPKWARDYGNPEEEDARQERICKGLRELAREQGFSDEEFEQLTRTEPTDDDLPF